MKTKKISKNKKPSASLLTVFLAAILICSLSGCQNLTNSAHELRSTIDKTVSNGQEKIDNIKNTVQTGVDQVKTSVEDTKKALDTKVQQINEAQKKVEDAQKALKEANEAITTVTK